MSLCFGRLHIDGFPELINGHLQVANTSLVNTLVQVNFELGCLRHARRFLTRFLEHFITFFVLLQRDIRKTQVEEQFAIVLVLRDTVFVMLNGFLVLAQELVALAGE